MSTLEFAFDVGALTRSVGALQEDVEAVVRPAAYEGARVLYREVHRGVEALGTSKGNLRRAIYHAYMGEVSGKDRAYYRISWNHRKAPHGHLIEFGHMQYFVAYVGKDGKWHTAIRPSMRGKRKPSRRASIEAKSRYYVPLKGGPRQIAARPFLRSAARRFPQALQAIESAFFQLLAERRK